MAAESVPEGGGRGEELALGVFGWLAVEQRVEFGDRRDFLLVECFVHLRLWGASESIQSGKPWRSKNSLCLGWHIYAGVAAASDVRVIVKTFAKPPGTFASSSSFC
jgi:hypothetical protein